MTTEAVFYRVDIYKPTCEKMIYVSPQLVKSGVKKLLVLEPGTSKISIRKSKNFHPMSDRQVKKIQWQVIYP